VPKPDYDRFAKIEILEPTEEKKPEEEKPEEEPEAEEAQPEDQPKEKKDKQPKKKGKRKKSKFAGGGGVLGALAKFNRSRRGKTSIAAMVSGIAAVRSSGGVRAFTVAGTGEGGVLGGKLVVGGRAGGPGMRTGTRSVADLFAGGKKRASLKGRKKSKVRGNVRKAGKRQIRSRGSGMLDKAAIAKVVNKNIGQVRYCYERTLLKAPNVRGKVILEWTIAPTGKVRSVSTSFSSVNADALTRCIMRKIKGWKFPKPKGGQVIVAYPFVFNSVGF